MASVVKYDVSNAEVRNFEVPKPGVYEAVIHEATHGDSSSGNPMFTIVFEVTKGDHKGARIWHYILTDGSQDWRLREFTDAMGLKPKGSIDPTKLVGTVVQLRTAIDPAKDGYDEKARVKNVLPAAGGNGASAEASDEEDEPPYDEWSTDDLKEEVEARELKITGSRVTKKKLIDALEADDADGAEEEEEEEGEEEEEEGESELSRSDLDGMSRAELKALIAEEELEIKVLKKHSDDDLRNKIAEALELGEEEETEEEGEEEEEEGDENVAYSEWEISELKAELKERGLKTEGRKSVLVGRLEKDDKSKDEPF